MYRREAPARFWAKVLKTPGCWLWQAATFPTTGYGAFRVNRQTVTAHGIAYADAYGEVPVGYEIDHLCRERRCVNPNHLEAVTHRENMRRTPSATKTHCVNGHPRTPENTYVRPDGGRQCYRCIVIRLSARYHTDPEFRERAKERARRRRARARAREA